MTAESGGPPIGGSGWGCGGHAGGATEPPARRPTDGCPRSIPCEEGSLKRHAVEEHAVDVLEGGDGGHLPHRLQGEVRVPVQLGNLLGDGGEGVAVAQQHLWGGGGRGLA